MPVSKRFKREATREIERLRSERSGRATEFGVKVGSEETVDSVAKYLRSLGWKGVFTRAFAAIAYDKTLGVGITVTVDVGKTNKVLKVGIGPIDPKLGYPRRYTKTLNSAPTPKGAARRLGK